MNLLLRNVLVALLLAVVLGGCKEEIYTDLGERQVNEMLAVLRGNALAAEKTADGEGKYSLSVESGQLATAINLLRKHGYPNERFSSMGQIFEKEGLLSSPLEERARYIYALSQSLAETLSQIDGVITARVHLVLPDNDPFEEDAKPSAASVFVKYNPQASLDAARADIKHIVEKSVEGLDYRQISVVMLPARPLVPANRPQRPPPVNEARWAGMLGVAALLVFAVSLWWRRRGASMSGAVFQGDAGGSGTEDAAKFADSHEEGR